MDSSWIGISAGSLMSSPSSPSPLSSPRDLRHRMDQDSHQTTHDRALDADELQVLPDVQLDLARRLAAVPLVDGLGDDRGQLTSVAIHEEHRERGRALVQPDPELAVVLQSLAERDDLG